MLLHILDVRLQIDQISSGDEIEEAASSMDLRVVYQAADVPDHVESWDVLRALADALEHQSGGVS